MPVFGNNIQSPYDTSNPQEPKKKQVGTGFTNLQTMLNKNSGAQLGNTIGSGISSQADDLKRDIGTEGTQYGQQLGQASSAFDANKRDRMINSTGLGNIGAPDEATTKTFDKYRSGDLGAQDLSGGLKGYGDLSSKAADVAQQGKDIESQSGRYNLLQRYASGGKQYTGGQKRLDSMLLGQSGGDALQQARLSTGGIDTQLQQAQEGAKAQYDTATGKAKQFAADTKAKLAGAQTDVSKDVNMDARKDKLQQDYKRIQAGLRGTAPTEVEKSLDPNAQKNYDDNRKFASDQLGGLEGKYLYGLKGSEIASNYSTLDPSKTATASQFATAGQNARMAALMKLSGKNINESDWGTSAGGEANTALQTKKDELQGVLKSRLEATQNSIEPGVAEETRRHNEWLNNRGQGRESGTGWAPKIAEYERLKGALNKDGAYLGTDDSGQATYGDPEQMDEGSTSIYDRAVADRASDQAASDAARAGTEARRQAKWAAAQGSKF